MSCLLCNIYICKISRQSCADFSPTLGLSSFQLLLQRWIEGKVKESKVHQGPYTICTGQSPRRAMVVHVPVFQAIPDLQITRNHAGSIAYLVFSLNYLINKNMGIWLSQMEFKSFYLVHLGLWVYRFSNASIFYRHQQDKNTSG